MYKIGQNVTVGYPDRNSEHKPGVIYNKTTDPVRGDLYWIKVKEKNGVTHCGDSYLASDVLPLEPTQENPSPEHFSVGSFVVLDGEKWRINAVENDGTEVKYLVHEFGMPDREVDVAELS